MNALKSVFYVLVAISGLQGYATYGMFMRELVTFKPTKGYDSAQSVIKNNLECARQDNIERIVQVQVEPVAVEKLQKQILMDHSTLVIPPFKNKGCQIVEGIQPNNSVSKPGTFAVNTKSSRFVGRLIEAEANKENIAGKQFSSYGRYVMRNGRRSSDIVRPSTKNIR